ncbi:MAG: hypothetical protein WBW06_20235, partial [Xanthobacteraceae bacterium]
AKCLLKDLGGAVAVVGADCLLEQVVMACTPYATSHHPILAQVLPELAGASFRAGDQAPTKSWRAQRGQTIEVRPLGTA